MTGGEGCVTLFAEALTAEQEDLLKIIWEPVPRADLWNHEPEWPLWDYVERSLYRAHPDLSDAAAVLASLPSVATDRPGRPYGLIWHNGHVAFHPNSDTRIGLTIAGLSRVSQLGANTADIADELAAIIGLLADGDAALEPNPYVALKADRPLAQYTSALRQATADKPVALSDRVIASILHREYAPILVFPLDAETGHTVQLGRLSLRAFREVRNASDYLARLAQDQQERSPLPSYASPLTLVQTLDYLGYVLAADPAWQARERLTTAPDLQSAAALSAVVTNRLEFESALSGLWNVIDQLRVPDLPREVVDAAYRGQQPRSMVRLTHWLKERVPDPAAQERMESALRAIRAVGRVRAEPQHGSAAIRRDAIAARRTLGLPDAVSDWQEAWRLLCGQLAGAFDVIRQEVQVAPFPASSGTTREPG